MESNSIRSMSPILLTMKRGTGISSGTIVASLADENDWSSEKLRSTAPMTCVIRLSPAAAIASSRSLEQVGDLRGSDGMLKMGSCSTERGDVGEWKVALFFKGLFKVGSDTSRRDEVCCCDG